MKSKCSFILRAGFCLLLAVLVAVGSMSSVIAAIIEYADLGGNKDLAATGWTTYALQGDMTGWEKWNFSNDSGQTAQRVYIDNGNYFRFYKNGNTEWGAKSDDCDINGADDANHHKGESGSTKCWKWVGESGIYWINMNRNDSQDGDPWFWTTAENTGTFTVAGEHNNWDFSDEDYDMSYDKEGYFKLTLTNLSADDSFNFKVFKNHSNSTSYPGSNYAVENVAAGDSLEIYFKYVDAAITTNLIHYEPAITAFAASGNTCLTGESITLSTTMENFSEAPSMSYGVYTESTCTTEADPSDYSIGSTSVSTESASATITFSRRGTYYILPVATVYETDYTLEAEDAKSVSVYDGLSSPDLKFSDSSTSKSINDGGSATLTIGNYADLSSYCDFSISYAGGAYNSVTPDGSGNITIPSATISSLATAHGDNKTITVKATIKDGSTGTHKINGGSDATASVTLKVYKPFYTLSGALNRIINTEGLSSDEKWNEKHDLFKVDTPTATPGVFTITFMVCDPNANIGFYDDDDDPKRYSVVVGTSNLSNYKEYASDGVDLDLNADSDNKLAVDGTISASDNVYLMNATDGSIKLTAAKAYTLTIDQTQSATINSVTRKGRITIVEDNTTFTGSHDVAVAAAEDGIASVTYNGVTKQNGQTLSSVPVGAKVTVGSTPRANYVTTSITVTGTSSGVEYASGVGTASFLMPFENVTVTETFTNYGVSASKYLYLKTFDSTNYTNNPTSPGYQVYQDDISVYTKTINGVDHYYAKIPISKLDTTGTYKTAVSLRDGTTYWKEMFFHNYAVANIRMEVLASSKPFLYIDEPSGGQWGWTDGDSSVNSYSAMIRLANTAYNNYIDYILLDVYYSTYGYYQFSVVFKDDAAKAVVFAKDGAVLDSSGKTYGDLADTVITYVDVDEETAPTDRISTYLTNSPETYEVATAAKGKTIRITTTIDGTNALDGEASTTYAKDKYYVRGFAVNGVVPDGTLNDGDSRVHSDGIYTLDYTIPDDFDQGVIEITPIYYIVPTYATSHSIKLVNYHITGITDEMKNIYGWGNAVYAYPFYGLLSSYNNAFGTYPGQPVVNYRGQYSMEVPITSTAWAYYSDTAAADLAAVKAKTISGITMSNGYHDAIHRSLSRFGNNGENKDHVQTYDYDDFYKIFNEKDSIADPVNNLVYTVKFKPDSRTNYGRTLSGDDITAETLTSTFDGFEKLTNYYGREVDLFGAPLSSAQKSNSTVYVVSTSNKTSTYTSNIAGTYGTQWYVYVDHDSDDDYKLLTATHALHGATAETGEKAANTVIDHIPPSVLYLNSASSFDSTTYPSAKDTDNIYNYKELYTALKAYAGHPVKISYEKVQTAGDSTRTDGRWVYSASSESITGTIQVAYSGDNGATYTVDTTRSKPLLTAYFTNTDVYGATTYSTTNDDSKTFDFAAVSSDPQYKFAGWYFEDGQKITDSSTGSTARTGSYTMIARFKQVNEGTLTLSHITSGGAGTATIAVRILDGDSAVKTYAATTEAITIENDENAYISSDSAYKIEVTLNKSITSFYDSYNNTTCSVDGTTFTGGGTIELESTSQTFTFDVSDLYGGDTTQDYKAIQYTTAINQAIFEYDITYQFNGRLSDSQSFKRSGTLTPAQVASYVRNDEGGGAITLSEEFLNKIAPAESNLYENLSWDVSAVADRTFSAPAGMTRTLTKTFTATSAETKLEVTFALPYAHTNGVATGGDTATSAAVTNYKVENISFGTVPKNGDDHIVAPSTLDDLAFQCWKIYKTSDTVNPVAYCYNKSFDYLVCENYYITPYYGEASALDTYATVTYLQTSRNQWNNDGKGSYSTTDSDETRREKKNNASDILFNDFMLSYHANGVDSIKENGINYEIGFVVQRIRVMDAKKDGSPDTDISHYTAEVTGALSAIQSDITALVNGGSTKTTARGTYSLYTVDKSQLSSRDRIRFFYALYNAYGWNDGTNNFTNTQGYKNYVYAAYAYIKDISEETVTVSSVPALFTMYNVATK